MTALNLLQDIKQSLIHLVFPHICAGCGTDHLSSEQLLCLQCHSELPSTDFHLHADNPVEKMFWGRLPLVKATAHYYFRKGSMVQDLVHELKYKGNKEMGIYLGELMGNSFTLTNYLSNIDALIPLPLHLIKQRKRGYNQSKMICDGISTATGIPVYDDVVRRRRHTESQTHKTRLERWENMKDNFELVNETAIEGKHILLVDDVVTTGATLEACGKALMKAQNLQLSIATLCISRD